MSKKTPINTLSRRAFLKRGCAAIASLPTMATMANLTLTSRALAETAGSLEGYKALVCVFLHGGNDSFNMLVPYENSADFNEYGDYVTIRESLALPRSELLAINDPMSGRQFGVNATMPDMHDLYNQGDLAFLANVGSLIQPTTRDDYNNGIQIPYKLFSHSDQQNQWQTAKPGSHILTSGWAGRALDILTGSTADPNDVFMNISLGGSNRLQTGASVFPYTVDAINSAVLRKMDYGSSVAESTFNTILDATLSENYNDHLLQKTYAEMNRDAVDFAVQMKAATD
ncbi:MAG TPA: DUF1501 domain-containing protein, partial [Chromatiaceae bacterium]|nr:DUF1501 domain-containing protein [Chromatiaceae bacterium]